MAYQCSNASRLSTLVVILLLKCGVLQKHFCIYILTIMITFMYLHNTVTPKIKLCEVLSNSTARCLTPGLCFGCVVVHFTYLWLFR